MAEHPGSTQSPGPTEDILLKRRELDLRELELRSKLANDKRNLMFTSPLLIAAVSAFLGW